MNDFSVVASLAEISSKYGFRLLLSFSKPFSLASSLFSQWPVRRPILVGNRERVERLFRRSAALSIVFRFWSESFDVFRRGPQDRDFGLRAAGLRTCAAGRRTCAAVRRTCAFLDDHFSTLIGRQV